MTATLREQADAVQLVGMNAAAHLENLRRAKRTAEAEIVEQRLPVLRDAYATLNKLAKDETT